MHDQAISRKRLQRKLDLLEAQFQAIQEPIYHGPGSGRISAAIDEDPVTERLSAALGVEIKLVRQALQRVDNGSYGICLLCGEPIDPRRLQALPEASTCRDCAVQAG